MSGLPELPERDLRRVIAEEARIAARVREALVEHGEIYAFRSVGADLPQLQNWIAIHARQFARLYLGSYLRVADTEDVRNQVVARLMERIRVLWLRRVNPERAAVLLACARSAIRDEVMNFDPVALHQVAEPDPEVGSAAPTRAGEPVLLQAEVEQSAPPQPEPDVQGCGAPERADAHRAGADEGRDLPPDRGSNEEGILLAADAVADLLHVNVQWVRDHTTRVEPILPSVTLGDRTVRYERDAIMRFIAERREQRPTWERKKRI